MKIKMIEVNTMIYKEFNIKDNYKKMKINSLY